MKKTTEDINTEIQKYIDQHPQLEGFRCTAYRDAFDADFQTADGETLKNKQWVSIKRAISKGKIPTENCSLQGLTQRLNIHFPDRTVITKFMKGRSSYAKIKCSCDRVYEQQFSDMSKGCDGCSYCNGNSIEALNERLNIHFPDRTVLSKFMKGKNSYAKIKCSCDRVYEQYLGNIAKGCDGCPKCQSGNYDRMKRGCFYILALRLWCGNIILKIGITNGTPYTRHPDLIKSGWVVVSEKYFDDGHIPADMEAKFKATSHQYLYKNIDDQAQFLETAKLNEIYIDHPALEEYEHLAGTEVFNTLGCTLSATFDQMCSCAA